MIVIKGLWSISGGTVYFSNKQSQISEDRGRTFSPWKTIDTKDSMNIRHGSDERGQYFDNDGVKYYKG